MASAIAPLVVVMGVPGCGKSTVGRLLARRLQAEFLEGEQLHPERNLERMAAGIELTEHDHRDWLREVAQQLADARAGRHALVVACPATRRIDRDLLRSAASQLAFVHLAGEPALLAARQADRPGRPGHPAQTGSARQALEAPGPDERALTLDAGLPADQLAMQAAAWIAAWRPEAVRKK